MQRLYALALLFLPAAAALADIEGDGYYRVLNTVTDRFITVVDNTGGFNWSSTTADLGALKTLGPFANVVSDPASVIYITRQGNEAYGPYDLSAQGTSAYSITGYYLRIRKMNSDYYRAYATASGVTQYLYDTTAPGETGSVMAAGNPPADGGVQRWEWDVRPVGDADGFYFGLTPEFTAADGRRWLTFYAAFPFAFASPGMHAYRVAEVDATLGVAVVEEVVGEVPAATPVLVECTAADPAANRLTLLVASSATVGANSLVGVYFENRTRKNYVPNDPATMRVLGLRADGTPGFVRSEAERMPRNRAYLPVPESAPAELSVMTRAEYEAFLSTQRLTVTARSYERLYGDPNPAFGYDAEGYGALDGDPLLTCDATPASPVGTYRIVASAGSVGNPRVDYVDGTLTVLPAPLTVRAADAQRLYGDANPAFALAYDGFRNGDDATALDALPTAATSAGPDSPAGTYAIEVSGGAARNYVFRYVGGTLTVLPAASGLGAVAAPRATADVYSLTGVKVRSQAASLEGLPRGIYIVGGRKVIVR